ncbi:uncharacterized protein LOC127857558 [Dreissena polymorpha]|uniref:Caspase recruitment domain-containing protein n=1 Tax=Dreissena polymorpha TaxID=45954 RepID=A0A9D3YZ57_DREPO|nr:uncharacterized protein LOC127857558 [Dreissena polymorpha]XP_052249964.1 uncharacterized protein LOC127857558 [Dreissena polymorpha]KAH3707710.1 hypothetical protein DPMN_067121 [Dreissena polymorpha]
MDDRDRKRFQAIQVRFAERVDSVEMLGYITCLTEHTRDTVKNSQTAHNGSKLLSAQTLFAALKCRPDGLKQAAYALRQCGHDDLANEIEPQEGASQASAHHHFHSPQRCHSLLEKSVANVFGANDPNVQHSNQGIPASLRQNASFRNGAPNIPDGSNSYPYVPGRDTVPNFQTLNMSATYPGASNVGLPGPTWSMSQQPPLDVNELQQQPYYQHQPVMILYDRNAPSNHSAPTMSEFQRYPQGDQPAHGFGSKEPSRTGFTTIRRVNTPFSQKNDLDKSDTENEDSDYDFTVKKNIEQEENSSSLPESDASKIINTQENAEYRHTLTNNEVDIEKKVSFRMTEGSFEYVPVKPQATGFDSSETMVKEFDNSKRSVNNKDNNATHAGFDSSETTLKSPIKKYEHTDSSNVESTIKRSLRSEAVKNNFETEITQENVENIRRECFSDVYSQTSSLLPSAPEVSIKRTAIVEVTQPIDQSLEDARIPEMRILRDDSELKSIMRKKEKANIFGISSYIMDGKTEDGASFVSDSEESSNAVNSDEGIISADGFPTTEGNTEKLNDHPKDLTKDQTKNNKKSMTAIRPELAENVNAENSTDERFTSWISFGSSLVSFTYKVLHPDV